MNLYNGRRDRVHYQRPVQIFTSVILVSFASKIDVFASLCSRCLCGLLICSEN